MLKVGRIFVGLLLALLALLATGCPRLLLRGKSPLVAPQMSPDSAVLEVLWARTAMGDPAINDQLWREVDEQQVPADVRRRLARHGFRAGVLDGSVPACLCRVLELTDRPAPTADTPQVAQIDGNTAPVEPRRRLHIRAGQPGEIVASGVYERMPVFSFEQGGLGGDMYPKAQGLLTVRSYPQPDGRVRVELVPEIRYGDPRSRWVGQREMLRLEASRPSKVFDDLAFSATLSPGSLLLVGSLPERSGSLGHHFLTEPAGQRQQKLLLVRLAQTQHCEQFSEPCATER